MRIFLIIALLSSFNTISEPAHKTDNCFLTVNEAAVSILNQVKTKPDRPNREYGGFITLNQNGWYCPSIPQGGDFDHVSIRIHLNKYEHVMGLYHNHPYVERGDKFSIQDKRSAERSQVDSYLLDCHNEIQVFRWNSKKIDRI